jgi:GNAT superfamily N-acetyltransferase
MIHKIDGPFLGQAEVCEPILRSLPDWFGIESALVQYVSDIEKLPTFLARDSEGVLGFLTIKQHNPFSAEVHVMGVLPKSHHRGVGRALMHAAQDWLRQQDVEYLQVKTLGTSHPEVHYAGTRAFYLAMGFRPLEELSQIWDENNPCLIMVKRL